MLYAILPLWGIAGFVDWLCHRATSIETTTGIKESIIHSIMGLQVGIPIVLCIAYRVNVLVLLLCLFIWIAHEVVAHWDIHTAVTRREISVWEMHAHSYLSTIPFYLLALIGVINRDMVLKLVSLDWAGEMSFEIRDIPAGGQNYLPYYLSFMGVLCVIPYTEELLRCYFVAKRNRNA
jgi:hypothetical protein